MNSPEPTVRWAWSDAAALEGLALDLALEGQPEPVAVGDHGVVALVLVAAVLAEDALDLLVDIRLADLDHRPLDLDGLEVHQRRPAAAPRS
jgi:hypothetical protein